MRHLVILVAAALAGCAGLPAKVTASTDRTVVVSTGVPSKGIEKALELAEAECSKRGAKARLQGMLQQASPDDRYIFECVQS